MAQSKNTKRSGSRSGSGRTGQRRRTSRRAQRRAERTHLIASLVLLGLGLLVLALVLVRGQEDSGWHILRGWLFGALGIVTYVLGPLLLYLAYLVASGYLVGKFSAKVGLMATLCASVPVVFSALELKDQGVLDAIKLLFASGQTSFWSGGVLGGVIGGPLVAFCGRPGANIIMVLVFLLGLMVFFAVTPVDVVQFVVYYWNRLLAWQEAARARAEQGEYPPAPEEEPLEPDSAPAPELPAHSHGMFADNPFLDPAPAAPAPAPVIAPPVPAVPEAPEPPAPAPRADFDIDLGPDIEQEALHNAVAHDPLEPVIIGPGGTFGLDPLKNLGAKKPEPQPAPTVTEFDQHLDAEEPAPGEEAAGTDELDELIQRAMGTAARGHNLVIDDAADRPLAEDEFDTLLEPVPGAPSAPVAPPVDGGVGITPAPAFGIADAPGTIPTLDGGIDPALAAWESGAPLAGALTAPAPERPEDAPHTAAATRYRSRLRKADPAGTTPTDAADPAGEPSAAQAPEKPLPAAQEPAAPEPEPYVYPSLDLFNAARPEDEVGAEREMRRNADILVNTLDSFGVKTKILDICRGPSVTRYELQPQAGIKVSRITSLADDIALNLATAGVRIEAPIPGKPAVGIEVPNKLRATVSIRAVFESQNYINMRSPLTMALGKDIAGTAQVADLCRMPHLLIAGSTGSGKSVCVNSIIISFLFRASPEDVKLILIDPKVVELAEYNGIPHLLMPVVTEPRKAAGALGASVAEMERRYRLFAEHNVREIKAFNKLAQTDPTLEHLPYIAIVIDELADLMMVAGKEVEDYICRIAQKARAAGIHLIVATQRPSVDVITGLIKANIPSRIAFAVSSQVDSRTILDGAGAEKLLGNGDMLFLPVGAAKPIRVQGTFVTDEEIAAVLAFIKSTSETQYDEEMIAEMERRAVAEKGAKKDADADDASGVLDPMFEQAVECVIEAGQASTSLLQRRCKLGYARAARIMDQMEQEKVIGPYEGAKPRSVLITMAQWQERKLSANHG